MKQLNKVYLNKTDFQQNENKHNELKEKTMQLYTKCTINNRKNHPKKTLKEKTAASQGELFR
jgi:hypothetical protein